MGRQLLVAALVLGAAVGAYFAFWPSPEIPDQGHQRPDERQVVPASVPLAPVTEQDRIRRELAATVALAPAQGFPAALPWYPLHDIGSHGGFSLENMLHARPLAFLQLCLERYDREVHGYTCTFVKKERINGKLYPPEKDQYEVIHIAFREQPFSVFFKWEKKAKLAARALYVEGENDGNMLARPFLTILPVTTRAVDSPDAKNSGRYTIAQFGMGLAMQRTVASMRKAQARGALHLRYEGLVSLAEVGDRVCHKFVRTPYDPPEEDQVNELTFYVDRETALQTGSVLRDVDGNLIAEYFFRDIVLNPPFAEKQFTRAAL